MSLAGVLILGPIQQSIRLRLLKRALGSGGRSVARGWQWHGRVKCKWGLPVVAAPAEIVRSFGGSGFLIVYYIGVMCMISLFHSDYLFI